MRQMELFKHTGKGYKSGGLTGTDTPIGFEGLINFFNTTRLSGQELKDARKKATGQTAVILSVFEDHPDTWFTPWDIFYKLDQRHMITSIRRAITTLTGEYLVKGERKRSGPANETNYTWKLKQTK